MKTALKRVSLAALPAAALALPVEAQDIKDSAKCKPKAGMSQCGGKGASRCCANTATCGASKCGAKYGAKCMAKCSPKCAPKH